MAAVALAVTTADSPPRAATSRPAITSRACCAAIKRSGVGATATEVSSATAARQRRRPPCKTLSLINATSIACGYAFSCAIAQTAASAGVAHVYCWGNNDRDRLGVATPGQLNMPGIALDSAGTIVAAGDASTCAQDLNGHVWCWGENYVGEIGIGTTTPAELPAEITGGSSTVVSQLTVGGGHACAFAASTGLECWGTNDEDEGGDGTTNEHHSPNAATHVTGVTVTSISAGESHTCIGDATGTQCWGSNALGQLGDGTGTSPRPNPTAPVGLSSGAVPSSGGHHTCALDGGKVYCWGDNARGQLGIGTFSSSQTAVDVALP